MSLEKDFQSWHEVKPNINLNKTPTFKEREVWWCHLGVNIGHEQDGKGNKFYRPVLIIKKFNKQIFWGVPLTTQIKDSPHYHQFTLKNKRQCAMLTQMKLIDARRINQKMGRIYGGDFQEIKEKLSAYLK